MKKIFYNKLVRDGIEAKITSKGEACKVRVIKDTDEFQQELLKKVVEEAEELAHTDSRTTFLAEYADLMVALDALTALMEFSEADITTALEESVTKKGFYKKRHFLHWADAPDDNRNETPKSVTL